jgi:hypothetical protein
MLKSSIFTVSGSVWPFISNSVYFIKSCVPTFSAIVFICCYISLMYCSLFGGGGGGHWGLNSGLYTCKTVAVPLESYLQSIFALIVLEMGSLELFAWAGLKLRSS